MPGFACYAMQSSSALLMLCRRSRFGISTRQSVLHITVSWKSCPLDLNVSSAHWEFSIAFKALDGMRRRRPLQGFDLAAMQINDLLQIQEA